MGSATVDFACLARVDEKRLNGVHRNSNNYPIVWGDYESKISELSKT
jgi:hypothetical protein